MTDEAAEGVGTATAIPSQSRKLEGEVGTANLTNEAVMAALDAMLSSKIEAIDKSFNLSADENQRLTYRRIQNGFREIRQAIVMIRSELRLIERRQRIVDEQIKMLTLSAPLDLD